MVQEYIAKRAIGLLLVMIGITLMTFIIIHLIPADPALAAAGPDSRLETVERMRQLMGLDKPLHEQYLSYVWKILHGDLGFSGRNQWPVLKDLRAYFPATVELAMAAMFLYVVVGIPLGIVAAVRWGSVLDKAVAVFCISGVAMPQFWLALMLQLFLFNQLGLFPSGGRLALGLIPPTRITGMYILDSILTGNTQTLTSGLHHICLPALTLALSAIANVTLVTRRAVLGVLGQDYIRTARAKGLPERWVIYRHALRNSLIPIVTITGLSVGFVLSGSVLVEIVFSWPGIGLYMYDSVAYIDFQPLMSVVLLIAIIYSFANLLVDLAYPVIDPRVSHK